MKPPELRIKAFHFQSDWAYVWHQTLTTFAALCYVANCVAVPLSLPAFCACAVLAASSLGRKRRPRLYIFGDASQSPLSAKRRLGWPRAAPAAARGASRTPLVASTRALHVLSFF